MREVVPAIPTLEAKQNLATDVRINGKKKNIDQIEINHGQGTKPAWEEKVTVLKLRIEGYDKD